MSLPADWVEYVFAKLQLRYGRDFSMRWEGLDLNVVKADWAEELDGFESHPALIEHALKHLPERAPTVIEFRRIARGGPDIQRDQKRIEGVHQPASREFVAHLVDRLKPTLRGKRDPRQWARDLLERHDTAMRHTEYERGRLGMRLATPTALAMAHDALREPAFTFEETHA